MHIKHIGIIGMAVMGRNLAFNIKNHGYNVSIFNRSRKKIDEIFFKNPKIKLIPFYSIESFVNSLKKPRCILLMIKAGKNIDIIIKLLKPLLDKGDIIIDGGNSFYKDTIRRFNELLEKDLNFLGIGISGGEEGALKGPSIMVGGKKSIYNLISPILKDISAFVKGEPCVSYTGSDGSGHYVKMIHNGIEYSYMQLISETYLFLKKSLNADNVLISNIFSIWNKGELSSYLIEITKNILIKKDIKDRFLIDYILDKADSKNTGKWISQNSLDLCEPFNLTIESVFSRYISFLKQQRIVASNILIGPKKNIFNGHKIKFIENLRRALYLSKIISYAQGFSQLRVASKKYNWQINYYNISKIFRGGCIIRSTFLDKIINIFKKYPTIVNILLENKLKNIINYYQKSLRSVVLYGIKHGIPMPVFNASISYYDSYRSSFLPANIIQAQRDYFGGHKYKRIDKYGLFHTKWIN